MYRLGFTNPKSFKNAYYGQKIEQIKLKNGGICRYIDFLKSLSGLSKYGFLIEYYIEYYDKKQKENIE